MTVGTATRQLLVLGSWDMRESAFASWASDGIDVTLVDQRPATSPARWVQADVWDSAAAAPSLLAALAAEADGVVTLAEFCTLTAALTAEHTGLPGPGATAARLARDKLALRRRLAAAGLPGPRFAAVSDHRDLASFFAGEHHEAVLKPADSAGSTAVYRVGSPEQAAALLPGVQRWSFSGRAIVEQLLPGPEFSVEAVVCEGACAVVAIVEKTTTPDTFVETRHVCPAALDARHSAELACALAAVVAAIEVCTGVVHAEFRLTPDGFVLIEIAVRPAGGLIPDLLRHSTGFDLYRAQAALAFGGDLALTRVAEPRAAGVQFITATGTVRGELDAALLRERHPGVVQAGQLVPAGTEIPALDTNGMRAGYVIATASTREALGAALDAAAAELASSIGLR